MKWGFLAIISFGIIASWAACLDPTQVTIEITTAYKPCGSTDTVVTTGSTTVKAPTCMDKDVGGRVGSLVIVPRKSVNDSVLVQVMAGVDGSKGEDCAKNPRPPGLSCIAAKRLVHFISHRSFTLPIELDRSCVNVECGANQTCEKGTCVNSDVTDPTCANDITRCPMEAGVDAGIDAPVDADIDAGVDSGTITAVSLHTNFDNACVVGSNGTLYCWGDNTHKQITTNPNGSNGPTPIALPGTITPAMTAIGGGHICVSDGKVIACWGNNAAGQVSEGIAGADQPVTMPHVFKPPNGMAVTTLVAGQNFACTVAGSTTYCWGQLGKGNYTPSQPVSTTLEDLAAGNDHICAIDVTGNVQCMGANASGQLGLDPQMYPYTTAPKATVMSFAAATAIYAGYAHTSAIDTNGPWAWGDNDYNVIKSPTIVKIIPTPTGFFPGQPAFGSGHVCIVDGGSIRCRGDNTKGQRGPGVVADLNDFYPVKLTNGEPGLFVGAGRLHSCAIGKTGLLYCWGSGPVGPSSPVPQQYVLK